LATYPGQAKIAANSLEVTRLPPLPNLSFAPGGRPKKEEAMNSESSHEDVRHDRSTTIFVNGRERSFARSEISFAQVVELANLGPGGENIVFTVTYKRGQGHKPEGTMVDGDTVKVKEGMMFSVTRTDKS
jgi:hypothetical protein